jgi:hypothetical protein
MTMAIMRAITFFTGSTITHIFLKRHLKINRAGDGIKISPGADCLVRKRSSETGMMHNQGQNI